MGRIRSVSICRERKAMACPVEKGYADLMGLREDIHYGRDSRQVSLLPYEIVKAYFDARGEALRPGRFGENLLAEGIEWAELKTGDVFACGLVRMEIVRIDASCPASDAYKGEKVCVPMEPYFVFCRVLSEGELREGIPIFKERKSE